ncbi:MAG: OsmC family protein [Anaerolineaceae bacterium]
MGTTTVRWVAGRQFVGTDSTGHSVALSTADEGTGVKPSDMLLVALSACTAVSVVDILAKKRLTLTHLDITASGEQDPQPPWTFRKIHLVFHLAGPDLTGKAVQQAIQISEEKYCSVAATIRDTAEITTEYRIMD